MPSFKEIERIRRVQDFESRAAYSESVLVSADGWRYIPVHDFGRPFLDAYCFIEGDIYFLQFWPHTKEFSRDEPGLYYRWSRGSPSLYNVVSVHSLPEVSRLMFEAGLVQIAACLPLLERPDALVPLPRPAA